MQGGESDPRKPSAAKTVCVYEDIAKYLPSDPKTADPQDLAVKNVGHYRSNFVPSTAICAHKNNMHDPTQSQDVTVHYSLMYAARLPSEDYPHILGACVQVSNRPGTLIMNYTGVGKKAGLTHSGKIFSAVKFLDSPGQIECNPITSVHPDGRVVSEDYFDTIRIISPAELAAAFELDRAQR